MLNRRYLRIKAMQALYSFFQLSHKDINKEEKDLFRNIDKIYDLYIYLLLLIIDIRDQAELVLEEGKGKHRPTPEEVNPNRKFIDNRLIRQLSENLQLKKEAVNRKINWQTETELVKKILTTLKAGNEYRRYMSTTDSSYQEDKNFVIDVFKSHISEHELLIHFFEEKSIHWVDDVYLVISAILKTFDSFTEQSGGPHSIMPLYKDEKDDKAFVAELFRKTIINDAENEKLIADKTKNWEVERIAMMDILLMKMAITEMMSFPNIPVKVSLNEYIEISKLYSSPKSKMFINGILDKLVVDLKNEQKVVKTGRGLIE